ncbi:hypothetical protein ACO2Q1_03280 [Brevundimonas sp. VNH65]|uniref:hypothetical protein n=1 Tax=Brevundimonas sp. VNH65 TaxID=3400917 RepID=UPI003C1238BF
MISSTETRPDRRPSIVICAYDAADDGWDLAEDLSGTPWSPDGARTVPVAADAPGSLAADLAERLRSADCRAILLVGRTRRSERFRIQLRAENRTEDGSARLIPTGPATARTTAPVADMVQAMREAGLAVDASSEEDEDVGSFLLYSVLNSLSEETDTRAVALLRAPMDVGPAAVAKGVKAAAAAIARNLSPLPRGRTG